MLKQPNSSAAAVKSPVRGSAASVMDMVDVELCSLNARGGIGMFWIVVFSFAC